MNYLGAKSGSGVYQAIINLMPPHDTYIEPFLGSGAIMRLKAPALKSIGLDMDSEALRAFSEQYTDIDCELLNTDAFEWLNNAKLDDSVLVYCDPPYVHSTRTSNCRYNHELTDADHVRLLKLLKSLDCKIILSGYKNSIYELLLREWFSVDFQAMTRGGVRTETVWCNFEPGEIHYHTYAGKNFTDRQRIKRKAERWAKRFEKLPPGERQAVLSAILAAGTT